MYTERERLPANEFDDLDRVAAERDIPVGERPLVQRHSFDLADGARLSAVVWGDLPPDLVLLHGGGQNAHTWDPLLLRLGRSAVAFDLLGHGRSSWREDRDYGPDRNARLLLEAFDHCDGHDSKALIGMSWGGLTAMRLAALRPEAVSRVVLIDVTPGSSEAAARMSDEELGSVALIKGPRSFDSFEEMVDAAHRISPKRARRSLARSVAHNAVKLKDGRWRWSYDLRALRPGDSMPDPAGLWQDFARIQVPVLLVTGGDSAFVTPADLRRARALQPTLQTVSISGAGHSVQGDRPRELGDVIERFIGFGN